MAMADGYGLFWNSNSGDRKYDAQSFEKWLKKFFTSGVFEGDLQVLASSGMTVQVQTGYSNVNGKVGLFESATNVTLSAANSRYPRIDTIIIERNDVDRVIKIDKVTGAYTGENPQPTSPIWDEAQGIYQLVLAQIYVGAGVSSISQEDITDKRTDTDVCGYIAGTVNEMDFSQFTAQFEAYFSTFEATQLAEFEEWFDHMKDQLDSDAAGHLQAEVDAVNEVIAPVQLTLTASQPYAIGEQFIYGGKLHTATSAIAEDATIVIGTNADLSAEIVKQIKSAKDAIGTLNSLTTTDKSSIVEAINEVLAKVIQSTRVPMENLGTAVTAEQLSYIENGEGYQLGLGSYWDDQAQGIVWRIWDFDKFYNTGDPVLKTRNACVLPDANLIHADGSTHYMNDTNTAEGGYNATKYRSTYRPQCKTKFANFFGSAHIITHRELLSNAVSSGAASGWSWYDCDVELPTEEMIYGHGAWGTSTLGGQGGYNVGNSWGRLALSLLKPEFVCNRDYYWLRNVVSASGFAVVSDRGVDDCYDASYAYVGFRPFALIS